MGTRSNPSTEFIAFLLGSVFTVPGFSLRSSPSIQLHFLSFCLILVIHSGHSFNNYFRLPHHLASLLSGCVRCDFLHRKASETHLQVSLHSFGVSLSFVVLSSASNSGATSPNSRSGHEEKAVSAKM